MSKKLVKIVETNLNQSLHSKEQLVPTANTSINPGYASGGLRRFASTTIRTSEDQSNRALGDAIDVSSVNTNASGDTITKVGEDTFVISSSKAVYVNTYDNSVDQKYIRNGGTSDIAIASSTNLGVIMVGSDLSITGNGVLNPGSNIPRTDQVNQYSKSNSVLPATLDCNTTVIVDASRSNNFRLILTSNATLQNPTNATDGMQINILVKQDATGGRILSYDTKYYFPDISPGDVTTLPNSIDFISMYYDAFLDVWICVIQNDFRGTV